MSPGSRRALLAALVLIALAGTAVVASADAREPAASVQQSAQQSGQFDVTNGTTTVISLSLRGDSDARWTVTERFNLSTESEREAFETLAARFRDGRSAQLGLPAFRDALDRVQPTVDRPMQIHEVTRQSSIEDGTLSLSFTWTNFARENNETRIVGDAFTTAGGTWLNGLGANQSLIVALPRGSAIDTPKRVTDGTIRWDGPTTFEPGDLEISYTANPPPSIPQVLLGAVVALLVFGVLGVVGGYLLTRRRDGRSLPVPPVSLPTRTGETDGESDVNEDATATEDEAGPTDDVVAGTEDEGVDLSLLSDEERVEYLLKRNGGRMKQANIVKETGWSNAKVSQLLSAMEEDGRITKLRIGRENLISFPDEDIGDFEDS